MKAGTIALHAIVVLGYSRGKMQTFCCDSKLTTDQSTDNVAASQQSIFSGCRIKRELIILRAMTLIMCEEILDNYDWKYGQRIAYFYLVILEHIKTRELHDDCVHFKPIYRSQTRNILLVEFELKPHVHQFQLLHIEENFVIVA